MNKSQAIQKYIYLFENLHSALTPGALDRITAQNIHFIDPFHDITGRQKLYDLLQHTLNTVEMADFTVTHTAWDQDVCFLRWNFSGQVRLLSKWEITGMSEIHFNDSGLICRHIDHWDAAGHFLVKLPLIGTCVRAILRKMQVVR
ncbi:MAG: hypothetical protein CMF31_08465 [Kordiimonas sp.]|nr:hypothetical protein [Kordiimonas sp.]|tara:strand:+ start:2703 stop:3137 length:435 start_codon:yes stop_codon:yes gene_type:complete